MHRLLRIVPILLLTGLNACALHQLGDDEASLVLEDVLARQGPSRLKSSTGEPRRVTVSYRDHGKDYQADLYTPASRARGVLIVLPGLNTRGHQDQRLVDLAASLVRAGFINLIPDLRESRHLYMARENVPDVIAAVRYMRRTYPRLPLGLGGISFASGPILAAAVDPAIRDELGFIVTIGGYYDIRNLGSLYTTGASWSADGPGQDTPALNNPAYLKWVIVMMSADKLAGKADRQRIRDYAWKRMTRHHRLLDTPPEPEGEDARALLDLIANRRPARFAALYRRLSPRVRENISAINPAEQDLEALRARAILIHGRLDHTIPASESRHLAKRLGQGRARLYLLDGLEHVNFLPRHDDISILLDVIREILAQRRP